MVVSSDSLVVAETVSLNPTESLTCPGKTKFYPLDIHVPYAFPTFELLLGSDTLCTSRHLQLRNFISTADQDWIYFASSYDIYALHLPSQRKYLLVTLPFCPRCLVAGLGWICAGGSQNGDSAFIQLNKKKTDTSSRANPNSPRRATRKTLPGLGQDDAGPSSHPELVLHELGGHIVNSITLHELSNKATSNWDEPVALVR